MPVKFFSNKRSSRKDDTLVEGDFTLQGDIFATADGVFGAGLHGSLTSEHHIEIADNATIRGPVSLGSGKICGIVEGNLSARQLLELAPGSRVRGALLSNAVHITDGADFQGSIQTGPSPTSSPRPLTRHAQT